ncbi:hypothetical protein CUR178_07162 [Leishmania enriettii]|uniref:RING-type domain-containing protein n=1 Tax=Leishmania enriettii TaxID=5663 RepID=A0A836HUM8_LEIEN|nr:hypothetical protein CUR178_07162 [Leishmania enriettii]
MSFLAREFRELEATSQLPPSTPQQHVAPSTVLLPATVGKLPPQLAAVAAVAGPVCASGIAVTMPQLSPSVARNVAAISPQASIQMCMAPVLRFSPFSGSPVLDGGARLQVTTNGYPDARADRVCSNACNRLAMVPAHILHAAASAGEDLAFGPLTSASSTATPRLSHSTAESLLMVNFTSAHHCSVEGTTPAMPEAITTGSGSRYTNSSDTCLTKRLSCSTASTYPHAQAPHQMCQVCHAPMTRVLTPVLDPSDPVTPGVGGAASRGGLVHRHTPPFSAASEGACAFHSLTSIMEPTAASATTPAMSPRSASHGQVNIGCPSTALEDGAPHQAPLSTATDTFSADSRTTVCVPPSLQDRMASAAPVTASGGFDVPSSTLYVAPPPPASLCHSDSATNRYPDAVGAKSSDGKSRGGGHTSATIAGTAMATALASSRLPPSPASLATATSPPPPPMRMSSSHGNDVHLHCSDSSAGNTSSTIAFVPIGVQPAFATAAPSFCATPACRSPAHAAVSAGEPAASFAAEAASAPPTFIRGLPSSSAALFTSSVPTMVALQQPRQASGSPREPTTPPLRQYPAPLATHPLQHTAYWPLPHAPAGTMAVILAAPEVNWHSLTGGRATTPASGAGAAASDACGHTFIADCSVRGMETPAAGSCLSPASIATSRTVSPGVLTTSPASSAGLEAQCASGGRGATRTTAGQTYRSVLVHGGCGVGGRGGGVNTGLTAPGSGYGLGLPLYSSQPQLLCTPVPLDDTESVCAICLEGRVSKTTMTETAESTALSSSPLQPPRAAEEESCQENDSGGGALSDLATADDSTFDEEIEHGTTRGVKPGSCLLSLPCGHCYHQNCVQRWLIESQSCPMCRRDLTRDATIS